MALGATALLTPWCDSAQAQQTKMLTADKHNEYGLVYRLPITALRIDVTARHTSETAGPFFQYAKRYMGTANVIKEDADKWEIIEVKVTPYGIPDTENEYLMQLKAGALTSICVDPDGMLLAINKEVEGAGDSPATNRSFADSNDMSYPARSANRHNTPTRKRSFADSNDMSNPAMSAPQKNSYLDYVNSDFLATQSSAKQAQMLAESIMEVRDARVSLTRGTADAMPTDGKQLELMLKSLEEQENAMSAAFTGITETETVTRSFNFVPDEAGKFTLFRMSDFAGFVGPDDYSGDPVYLTVDITREEEMPVDAKGNEKAIPKDAVIYNIPGAARIALTLKGQTLWSGESEFAQYGVQFGLQPSLFSDKKSRSYAIFDPATGALLKIAETE